MAIFDRSMMGGQELPVSMPVEERTDIEAPAPAWGPLKRIFFRLGFVYLLLYLLPAFLGVLAYIPFVGTAIGWYFEAMSAVVVWLGKRLLGVDALAHPTGSGDSMISWVEIFSFLLLSILAALVWTLLDRKRTQYARLYEWLRVYVRLGLGMTMISYGAFKIIPSQFPHPSLDRLLQSIGDSSPMGILWTFMGASAPYTVFSGLVEWVGGSLLLFRRTMRLGALVCVAALTNVVMLNFCYDVPVKQYSSHLLAMAIFLAAPDLRRLADLLVLNRTVPAVQDRPLFRRRWLWLGGLALETVLLLGYTAYSLNISYQQYRSFQDVARLPMHGVWDVDDLVIDGQERPLVATDGSRWRHVVFDYTNLFSILPMDGTRLRYVLTLDRGKKTLALTKRDDPKWKSTLTYQEPAPGKMTIEGTFDGRKVRAALHRVEPPRFTLLTRGFHWVSEYPFNH